MTSLSLGLDLPILWIWWRFNESENAVLTNFVRGVYFQSIRCPWFDRIGKQGTNPSPDLSLGQESLPHLWSFWRFGLRLVCVKKVVFFSLWGLWGGSFPWGQCWNMQYNTVVKEGALFQSENADIIIIYWLLSILSALYVLIRLSHTIVLWGIRC